MFAGQPESLAPAGCFLSWSDRKASWLERTSHMMSRLVPFLWLRLVVLIGFCVFVASKDMWLITGIAVLLTLFTGMQLAAAYRGNKN